MWFDDGDDEIFFFFFFGNVFIEFPAGFLRIHLSSFYLQSLFDLWVLFIANHPGPCLVLDNIIDQMAAQESNEIIVFSGFEKVHLLIT